MTGQRTLTMIFPLRIVNLSLSLENALCVGTFVCEQQFIELSAVICKTENVRLIEKNNSRRAICRRVLVKFTLINF